MAARYQKHTEDHSDSLVTKIVKDIAVVHDWLAGPAMSERERLNRDIAEARPASHIGNLM